MKKQYRTASAGAILVCALVFAAGCGAPESSLPAFASKLVPVTGTVTSGGKPLVRATVTFIPQAGEGERATGVSDAQGKYVLFTGMAGVTAEQSKGGVPGTYKVTISHILMPDGSPVPEGTTEADAMAVDARESLPPAYSDPEQTTLTATVTADQSTPIDFELPAQ